MKIFLVSVCAVLALALTGFAANMPVEDKGSNVMKTSGVASSSAVSKDAPIPADAAMYRGTVAAITNKDGKTWMLLNQAKGTDFGKAALRVEFTKDTRTGFKLSDIEKGDYLVVYYGTMMGEKIPSDVTAIAANKLIDADRSIYNGVIDDIKINDDGTGMFMMRAINGKDQTLFRFNKETKIYLDFANLKKGDKLNIYYSGITTRSLPPQATAMEIRTYYSTSLKVMK